MSTACRCPKGHIRRVTLSPLHIMGGGTYWLAARPGESYLVRHGFHFYSWTDAINYVTRAEP